MFGPRGPFSTPEISRYPAELTNQSPVFNHVTSGRPIREEHQSGKRISFADQSDQSGFAEDRSDKSQYISNTVIQREARVEHKQAKHGVVKIDKDRISPGSRVDKYHQESRSRQGQEVGGDAWVQEKQKRMLSWINRSQVALGARIVGKTSS